MSSCFLEMILMHLSFRFCNDECKFKIKLENHLNPEMTCCNNSVLNAGPCSGPIMRTQRQNYEKHQIYATIQIFVNIL